jgi:hypothetical protein
VRSRPEADGDAAHPLAVAAGDDIDDALGARERVTRELRPAGRAGAVTATPTFLGEALR